MPRQQLETPKSTQALDTFHPSEEPPSTSPAGSAPHPGDLVDVSHKRELRGAWVASVWNINFPSASNLDATQQKQEIKAMLDTLQNCGFNAVFFQVRPEGDALYKSDLEPWGVSLTGTQGRDPGYDPLATFVTEAHKRNMEVHAWMNPYRASAQARTQVSPHLAVEHPEHVHLYGSSKWMDPGAEVVKDRLVDVCKDIAHRYDVDGIHFDDYFYPYPNGKEFPDARTYAAYRRGGGTLSRADWRRDNVNQAVKSVDEALESEKDYVRFGISPFGLPAPDRPEGVTGFDQYESLYADTQKWMDDGWVDYLAPQLYWPTTKRGQPYETLVKYWNEHSKDGRAIFPGNNLQAVGTSNSWSIAEFREEVELSRRYAGEGGAGNIWWNVDPILKNKPGVRSMFHDLYSEPALSPVMPEARDKSVAPPSVTVQDGKIQLRAGDRTPLRSWTVYRREDAEWKLNRIVPSSTEELELGRGTWAVAAASRQGVESQGVVVTA